MPEIAPEIQIFIQLILREVLSIAVIYLVVTAGAWFQARKREALATLPPQQLHALELAAGIVTRSVEKSALNGYIANEAQAKRAEAIRLLDAWTKRIGFTQLDEELLVTAIESAIAEGLHRITPAPVDGDQTLLADLEAQVARLTQQLAIARGEVAPVRNAT